LGACSRLCAAARRIGKIKRLDEINGNQQVTIVWCPVHRRYEALTVPVPAEND
jgi:hypothetical protein